LRDRAPSRWPLADANAGSRHQIPPQDKPVTSLVEKKPVAEMK
jgi:hypothetical protein